MRGGIGAHDMLVALTGASGFIGSYTAAALRKVRARVAGAVKSA